ncbi:MAG: hypothetical protein Udaeo_12550 [Candidatus Udaeobacter sp.]|nr:MAG: hypothetical protein Udaeo_12550 [Candidatus Udaeobacter sp.]
MKATSGLSLWTPWAATMSACSSAKAIFRVKQRYPVLFSRNWLVACILKRSSCWGSGQASCISHWHRGVTMPRSRRSRSAPWHNAPFIKACALRCAARLRLWRRNCRMSLRNSEVKPGKCSRRKKRYWRAKNDCSIVERTPQKSGFTATIIWGNWFIRAKISSFLISKENLRVL